MRDNQGLTRLYAPISDNRAVSPRTSRSRPTRQRSPRPVSGYLRDNARRKHLDEKVKETARTRQAAEDGLRAAQDMLDQARRVDTNVAEAERALAEASAAMAAKDYKVAVDKSGEALERGRRSYRERARGIVDSSAALGRLAKGLGADLAETESTVAKAEGALAAEDLGGAIDHAKKAWKRSEKILQEHLSSSFSKVQALILSAKNMNRDVAPIEDLLSRARTAMENNDFQSALDFTKEGLDTIREDMNSALTREIRIAEDLVRTAAELGADTTKPARLIARAREDLNTAREAIRRGAFQEAIEHAKRADVAVDAILDRYRKVETRLKELHRSFAEVEGFGVQTVRARKLAETARQAYQERNPAEVEKAVQSAFEELRRAERERVLEAIERAEFILTVGEQNGVDLSEPSKLLQEAIVATKADDYRHALNLAAVLQGKAERRLAEHAAGLISTLRTSLPYLGDESGSLKALVNRADASMASQDFEGAFKAVAEGQTLVEARVRTRAEEIVADLALAVRIGVDLGANVATLEALHRDLNAYLGGGRVAEIVATRDKATAAARTETDKLTVLYSSAQKILSSRSRLELAERLGIAAPHLRQVFADAKEAMKAKDYAKALAFAQRTEDEFTALIKERLASSLMASEEVLSSLEGVDLAAAGDTLVP